jgi:hypothetical protein
MVIACGLSGVFVFVPSAADYSHAENLADAGQLAEMLRVVFQPQTDGGPHSEVCTPVHGAGSRCVDGGGVDTAHFCGVKSSWD